MQTVTFEVFEDADVQALFDAKMAAWVEWSHSMTDAINTLTEKVTSLEEELAYTAEINVKQGRRITALSARVTALEERIAAFDTYDNTY